MKDTWKIWEQICIINRESSGKSPVHHAFGPMILLDPGSLAFDYPEKHGYRIKFNNIEEYIKGMSLPSWHQWISYETRFLNRDAITQLIIDSIECSINLRERFGIFDKYEADMDRVRLVTINKTLVDIVNGETDLQGEDEKLKALVSLRESLIELSNIEKSYQEYFTPPD